MSRSTALSVAIVAVLMCPLASCAMDARSSEGGYTKAPKLTPTKVYRPPSVPAGKRVPLFVTLGGYGATGPGIPVNTQMNAIADKYGFVVAYPTSPSNFKGKPAWRDASWMPRTDIDYLRKEIIKLVKAGGIDRRRVFVVGTSMGGSMAYRIGCELASRVAGVGSVSGAMFMKSKACKPARSVSVLTIVGDKDGSLPLAGKPGIAAPGKTSGRWARLNHCRDTNKTQSGIVTTRLWSGCRHHSKVALDVIAGGHHGWPGVRPFDSGEAFWRFFSSVRLAKKSSRP